MALVGDAGVSSTGQSLEVQLDKLKDCKKIFLEKKSAAAMGKRPRLDGITKAKKKGIRFGA